MATLADPGRGPTSPLFLNQLRPEGLKKFFGTPDPPYYLKVWIWHWVTPKDLIHLSER